MAYTRIYTRTDPEFYGGETWTIAPNTNYGVQAYSTSGGASWEIVEDLVPGTVYKLYVTWDSLGDASNSVYYEAIDLGDAIPLADENVDQTLAPSDITYGGVGWKLIGEITAGYYGFVLTLGALSGKRWTDAILITTESLSSTTFTGNAHLTKTHQTLTATGTKAKTGSASLSKPHPLLTAEGDMGLPTYTGSATLSTVKTMTSPDGHSEIYKARGVLAANRPLALWKCDSVFSQTTPDSSGYGRTLSFSQTVSMYGPYLNTQYYPAGIATFSPFMTGSSFSFVANLISSGFYSNNRRDLIITPQFSIYIASNNKVMVQQGVKVASSTSTIGTSTLSRIVISFEDDGHLLIAINGVTEYYDTGWTSEGAWIGQIFSTTNRFTCLIDEIKFYDNAISDPANINPDSQILTKTMSAEGEALPPQFRGSAALSKSKTMTASSVANDGTFRGTAHLSTTKKKTSETLGLYSYTIHANGGVTKTRPVAWANVTTFMPGYLPLTVNGSSEWSTLAKFPLVVKGKDVVTNSIPLVIASATRQVDASIPLTVYSSGSQAKVMSLVVVGRSAISSTSGIIPLSITGSVVDSISRSLPLEVRGSTPRVRGSMPLVVHGPTSGDTTNVLPLVVVGGNARIASSVPLYVAGRPSVSKSLTLFVKGPPGTPGAVPVADVLPLVVKGGFGEALQGGIPLVVGGREVEHSIPLIVTGRPTTEAVLLLYVCGVGGVVSRDVSLVVSGSEPTPCSSSIPLVISSTYDEVLASRPLFVNGWK